MDDAESIAALHRAIDLGVHRKRALSTPVGLESRPGNVFAVYHGIDQRTDPAHACVGCGMCQSRCHAVNAIQKGLLDRPAIVVEAGEGKEDRLLAGSYMELRMADEHARAEQEGMRTTSRQNQADYLPEF